MRKRMGLHLVLVVIATFHCGEQRADASIDDEVLSQQESKRLAEVVEYVWAGYRNNLERLQRGVFKAAGVYSDKDPNWGDLSGDYSVFCAFDFHKQMSRFDVSKPFRRGSSGAEEKSTTSWEKAFKAGKFVKTPDETVFYVDGSEQLLIDKPERNDFPIEDPFDVRALGIAYWNDMERGLTWNDISGFFRKRLVKQVKIQKHLYEITYAQFYRGSDNVSAIHTVVFDSSKGFAPISYELRYGNGGNSPSMDRTPNETCQISWNEYGKEDAPMWLPATYDHVNRGAELNGGRVQSKHLMFTWTAVNEEVAPANFTVQGLGLPASTRVMDLRLKEPIVVGTIGDPNKFVREKSVSAPSVRWASTFTMFVTVNAVLIGAYLLIRSTKQASS